MRIHLSRVRSRLVMSGIVMAMFLAVASVAVRGVAGGATDLAYNADNLIRLHIIANSDSDADQALKRAVRDEILKRTEPLFRGATKVEQARQVVRANLRRIEEIGQATVRAAGYDYPVRAVYGTFAFPAKTYGSLALPPGRYQAVRVIIGKGEGKNWWCVLFPPLCFLKMDTPYANGRVVVTKGPATSAQAATANATMPGQAKVAMAKITGPVQVHLVGPTRAELSLLLGFPMTTPTRIPELLEALKR